MPTAASAAKRCVDLWKFIDAQIVRVPQLAVLALMLEMSRDQVRAEPPVLSANVGLRILGLRIGSPDP